MVGWAGLEMKRKATNSQKDRSERELLERRALSTVASSTTECSIVALISPHELPELPSDLLQQAANELLLLLRPPERVALDLLKAAGNVRVHGVVPRQRAGHHLI